MRTPIHCSLESFKCILPRKAPLPAGYKLQAVDLLEGRRGTSSLLFNLDNSKVEYFPLLQFARFLLYCLQYAKNLANLPDKSVPEWCFSERQAELFPAITQHQTSTTSQNLQNPCLKSF